MNRFEKGLLFLFFVELFLGGGGRLIDFGFLSIRQALFLLLIAVFIIRIISTKNVFNRQVNTFIKFSAVSIGIYLLLIWFVVSAIIGYINGHSLAGVVTDFFRVSFFVVYFPLAYYITEERFPVKKVLNILKGSALVVALFTITVSLLGKTVFSANFDGFYYFMNGIMNDDLYFRPSHGVFYKSQLFVLIALILALNNVLSKKYTKLDVANIFLCSFSILLSETRGFLLAFMISMFVIILFDTKLIVDPMKGIYNKIKGIFSSKQFLVKTVIMIFIVAAVPFLYKNMTLERFQEETVVSNPADSQEPSNQHQYQGNNNQNAKVNDESVNVRVHFINDSKELLLNNPNYLMIGTGYGTEIGGRASGIEMSFLEILVEQGLVGLAIWFFLFFLVYLNFHIVYKRGGRISKTDISLLASFMGLLLLTNINPFINNPIGISFFLVLLILSQKRKEDSQQVNTNGGTL